MVFEHSEATGERLAGGALLTLASAVVVCTGERIFAGVDW
jgi:hypothetical protein